MNDTPLIFLESTSTMGLLGLLTSVINIISALLYQYNHRITRIVEWHSQKVVYFFDKSMKFGTHGVNDNLDIVAPLI